VPATPRHNDNNIHNNYYNYNTSNNKNLAIANIARQLRTEYVEGIYRPKYYTLILKSRLKVTQGHWKRNRWIDHTQLRAYY